MHRGTLSKVNIANCFGRFFPKTITHISAGCAYDGPYHVCRLWDRINGKAHLSHGRCFAPYQGGEASETYFEILVCLNEYWRNETTINDDQQAH